MPLDIDRRGFNYSTLLLAFTAACRPLPWPDPLKADGEIVDVHCHLFNGKDLPIVTFITKVVIPDNEPAELRTKSARGVEDPTVLEAILELFKDALLASTPSAAEESDYLRGRAGLLSSGTAPGARSKMLDALTDVVRDRQPGTNKARAAPNAKIARLRTLLLEEGGRAGQKSLNRSGSLSEREARQIALEAYDKQSSFGIYLRWFTLFMQYRYELVEQLAGHLANDGKTPVLLVPLMIDYTKWLGETPAEGSSLQEQAEVFGLISQQRRSAPAIHGMVAYDPLRAVYHKHRPDKEPDDPLATVREALEKHGFLGVKLYPPMGFRATGNTDDQDYPDHVEKDLGAPGLGRKLDDALDLLYDTCMDFGAPVIAHGAITLGPEQGYAKRTDPAYWLRVLDRKKELRVCIAHQGHFGYKSEAPETKDLIYEEIIGRYVKSNPDSYLYMDISYLSEALTSKVDDRHRYADKLRQWIADYDPDAKHILFGTDWSMVARGEGRCRLYPKRDRVSRMRLQIACRPIGTNPAPERRPLSRAAGWRCNPSEARKRLLHRQSHAPDTAAPLC